MLRAMSTNRFAGKMIVISGIAIIALNLAVAALYFFTGNFPTGIIIMIFSAVYAYLFWSWRHRIPFAKIMLKTVTRTTGEFPATFFTGFIGLVLSAGFSFLWLFTCIGWSLSVNQGKITQNAMYGLGFYLVRVSILS